MQSDNAAAGCQSKKRRHERAQSTRTLICDFDFGLIRGRDAVQHCASHPTHPPRCHTSKLFLEVVAGNHRSGYTVW